jgi:surface antigen
MSTLMKTATIILLAWLATGPVLALADPPRHAPAHGWRKKNDPFYVGFTGRHWDQDYGILSGHCNREAVATVLGGIIGGTIGAKVADRDDRAIAVIIGATAGALIGNRIGRDLDDADRSCIGHAMEIGESGQRITWTNETTGVDYELTPGADRESGGDACREFTLVAATGDIRSRERGLACESDSGVWRIED